MTNFFYACLLGFSGLISLVVASLAWKRRHAVGAVALTVMMLALFVWCMSYAAFWMAPLRSAKLLWLDLAYPGVVTYSPAFLVMAAQIAGHTRWLTRRLYFVLAIPAVLVLFSLWTDPRNGFFFVGVDFSDPEAYRNGGAGFWIQMAYSTALMYLAMVLLILAFARADHLRREQIGLILIGSAFPFLSSLLGFLHLSPLHGMDLTPLAFVFSGVFYAASMFSRNLIDLAPIGREAVVEQMEESVLVLDRQNRVVDLNARARAFLETGTDDPIGKSARVVFAAWLKESGLDLSCPATQTARLQVKLQRGSGYYYDIVVTPLADPTGEKYGCLIMWRDITSQKQIEEKFQRFYFAVEQSNASIVITDIDSRIEYVNPYFTRTTGYEPGDVLGKTPQVLKSGKTPDAVYKSLWQAIKSGEEWGGEMLNKKKNGELFWEYNRISPVTDTQGHITHYLAIKDDITPRKNMEAELREANLQLQTQLDEIKRLHALLHEESIRDGLTGLFNRKFMEETLEREVAMALRKGLALSVVMLDVDHFKSINDTFGHRAGDTVIQTLGEFLLQNTRGGDIACRYGGDEILVVMPNATLDAAYQRAEEWRNMFLGMKFVFDGIFYSGSLSLGVASFPAQVASAFKLLAAADKALYAAKQKRNCACRYDPQTMTTSNLR